MSSREGSPTGLCYRRAMPRWFFILLCAALALSVTGGVLIVLKSPSSLRPAGGQAARPS